MGTKVISLQEFNEKNLTFDDINGKVVDREVYEYLKDNGDDYHTVRKFIENENKITVETLEYVFKFKVVR